MVLKFIIIMITIKVVSSSTINLEVGYDGVDIISEHGYDNCIELRNAFIRVVLEPNMGGRVLIYEINGENILHEDPTQAGLLYPDIPKGHLSAGRFDIGPETITPPRPLLFFGKWEAKITGNREAELISLKDPSTGVQLIRKFRLDKETSRLECTQEIINISNDVKRYNFWARTFVKGGGISLTPMNQNSRYPKGYITYGPGSVMNFEPEDEPNVRIRDGVLEITGPPVRPKFVMDGDIGWMAYISKNNQLFIKVFPVCPDRIYGEMTGATSSVWYNGEEMVEIEPIGPWEIIKPGEKVSFTEYWYLFDFPYPNNKLPDLNSIRNIVDSLSY
jgi:hypothetical protein